MVLDEIETNQVLVAARSGLEAIDLRYCRSASGFQLNVVFLESRFIIQELFISRRSVGRRISDDDPQVDATIPNVNDVFAMGNWIATFVQDNTRYTHPVTAGVVGVIL